MLWEGSRCNAGGSIYCCRRNAGNCALLFKACMCLHSRRYSAPFIGSWSDRLPEKYAKYIGRRRPFIIVGNLIGTCSRYPCRRSVAPPLSLQQVLQYNRREAASRSVLPAS